MIDFITNSMYWNSPINSAYLAFHFEQAQTKWRFVLWELLPNDLLHLGRDYVNYHCNYIIKFNMKWVDFSNIECRNNKQNSSKMLEKDMLTLQLFSNTLCDDNAVNLTRYFTQATNWSPQSLPEKNSSRWRHISFWGEVWMTGVLLPHKHHKRQNEGSIGITIFAIYSMYLALHYIRDLCYAHFTANLISLLYSASSWSVDRRKARILTLKTSS